MYSNQVLKILNGAHSLLKSISSDKNRHVSRMLVFKDKCLQITPTKKKIKTIKTIFLKLYIYKRVGGGRNHSYMLFEGG
jgi:hypothetical protein